MLVTRKRVGRGLVNKLIDLLPFEVHIPGGYRYCGPGTKLAERLKRGDPGINPLDNACKDHDIAYSKFSDTTNRNKADIVLADKAWERVKAADSSLGERAAAYAVTNAMKLKAKLGAGCSSSKRKKTTRRRGRKKVVRVGAGLRKRRRVSKKKKRIVPRIIPLPTSGGGMRSALTRMGVASRSVGPALKKIRAVVGIKKRSTKLGNGLYLRPYKTGYGLYLRPPPIRSALN